MHLSQISERNKEVIFATSGDLVFAALCKLPRKIYTFQRNHMLNIVLCARMHFKPGFNLAWWKQALLSLASIKKQCLM